MHGVLSVMAFDRFLITLTHTPGRSVFTVGGVQGATYSGPARQRATTMSADAIATALAPMVTQLVALKEENERLKSSVAPTLQRLEVLEERLRDTIAEKSELEQRMLLGNAQKLARKRAWRVIDWLFWASNDAADTMGDVMRHLGPYTSDLRAMGVLFSATHYLWSYHAHRSGLTMEFGPLLVERDVALARTVAT